MSFDFFEGLLKEKELTLTRKRLFVRAGIQASLVSGLAGRCLSRTQEMELERAQTRYCRSLIGLQGFTKRGSKQDPDSWRSAGAEDVRKLLKIPTVVSALRVLRLRLVITMLRYKHDFRLVWGVLLGELGEKGEAVTEEGHFTDQAAAG